MDPEARGQERLEDGAALLLETYRLSRGRRWGFPPLAQVAEELGWRLEKAYEVASELADRGWLEGMDTGPSYRLTDEAQDRVEADILEGRDSDLVQLVEELHVDRSRVLGQVYQASGGSLRDSARIVDVTEALQMDRDRVIEALMWLDARELVRAYTHDSALLLVGGLDLVERGREQPAEAPDPRVAAFGDINVVDSPGATVTVVQGSPGAVVDVDVEHDAVRVADLRAIIEQSRVELPADPERDQALALLESETGAGRSGSAAIRRALGRLETLALGTGASALGAIIAKFLAG